MLKNKRALELVRKLVQARNECVYGMTPYEEGWTGGGNPNYPDAFEYVFDVLNELICEVFPEPKEEGK